jgi:arabinose-5-phosphate isomerase
MVTADDVILALSWSGETAELRSLIEYSRRWEIGLVAITARPESTLARQSDIVLALPTAAEACPDNLGVPTTSTLMQLALGDALAVALLESRGFDRESFHALHPGGRLGASLHFVRDVMHRDDAMPLTRLGAPMREAIMMISGKRLGCVGIVDDNGALVGIITDGDLRRHLDGPDLLRQTVETVMTRGPKTIARTRWSAPRSTRSTRPKITTLFIVENGKPIGIVHMHDLLRLGVA